EKAIITSDINTPNIRSKFYSSDGTVEIVMKGNDENATGSYAKIFTYIGGDAYTAPAIYVTEYSNATSKTSSYYYLHRDYQGSIMAISNQGGNVIERRHFDPWGNLVKFTNASGVTTDNPDIDRKSTRLNSSHVKISYAVFCMQQKMIPEQRSS